MPDPVPLSHRVELVRLDHGEHLPLVVGPDGVPSLFPNLWLLELRRRPTKVPQSQTLESYAYVLALFEDFLADRGIDVMARHLNREPFSRRDGTNLAVWLSRLSPHTAARRAKTVRAETENHALGLTPRLPTRRRTDVVCGEVRSQRSAIVCAYLLFLSDLLEEIAPCGDGAGAMGSPFGVLRKALKAATRNVTQQPRTAMPDEIVRVIFEALVPAGPQAPNPANPFLPAVQFRNFAMMLVLSCTAVRISELLGLKLEDLDLDPYEPSLTVMRRPDDPDDLKVRKTQAKTLPRTIQLPLEVAGVLIAWLDEHRSDRNRFGDASKCPFVFLAHEKPAPSAARQLSRSGAHKIFRTLRARDARIGPDATAHRFRHAWVTRSWKKRFENGQDDPFFDELVAYRMGWTDRSQQARSYARLAIEHAAGKFTVEWQDHVSVDLKIPDRAFETT